MALETVLQPQASGRLWDLLALPARWANRFLDPSVPALHKGTVPAAPSHPTGDGGGGGGTARTLDGKPLKPGQFFQGLPTR